MTNGNNEGERNPGQVTTGRTWADVAASLPVGLVGVAALLFVALLIYATFGASRPVELGFLGSFGARDTGEEGIPEGAVLAFDLPDGCPNGWVDVTVRERERYAGRVLVVAGPRVERPCGGATRARAFNDQGGTERHTLTEAEMPLHNHKSGVFDSIMTSDGRGQASPSMVVNDPGSGRANLLRRGRLVDAGHENPRPIELTPPFIALYFCKKLG